MDLLKASDTNASEVTGEDRTAYSNLVQRVSSDIDDHAVHIVTLKDGKIGTIRKHILEAITDDFAMASELKKHIESDHSGIVGGSVSCEGSQDVWGDDYQNVTFKLAVSAIEELLYFLEGIIEGGSIGGGSSNTSENIHIIHEAGLDKILIEYLEAIYKAGNISGIALLSGTTPDNAEVALIAKEKGDLIIQNSNGNINIDGKCLYFNNKKVLVEGDSVGSSDIFTSITTLTTPVGIDLNTKVYNLKYTSTSSTCGLSFQNWTVSEGREWKLYVLNNTNGNMDLTLPVDNTGRYQLNTSSGTRSITVATGRVCILGLTCVHGVLIINEISK